jgi:DNA-binding transcriptional ArsR family regulator
MYRIITFGKCFADPTAVRIIRVLLQKPLTIQDLQEVLHLDRHTVDLRLTKLREARIVDSVQAGRWHSYSIRVKARLVVERLMGDFYDEIQWDTACVEDQKRLEAYKPPIS